LPPLTARGRRLEGPAAGGRAPPELPSPVDQAGGSGSAGGLTPAIEFP